MSEQGEIPKLLVVAYEHSLLQGTATRLNSLFTVMCAPTVDIAIGYLHHYKFDMIVIGWEESLSSKIVDAIPSGTTILKPKDPDNWYNQNKIYHEIIGRLLYGREG